MKQEHDDQQPANVTDAMLWRLVRTVRARHQRDQDTGTCGFCSESWPCGAEQRAARADAAARFPVRPREPEPEPGLPTPRLAWSAGRSDPGNGPAEQTTGGAPAASGGLAGRTARRQRNAG